MVRREFLNAAGGLAGLFALQSLAAAERSSSEEKPNIVILYADDLGYADTAVYSCKDIPTPNIDALAKNGVRFTNGYVSGCVCSPSRAGLVSGRYQQRFGFDANAEGKSAPDDTGPRALDIKQVTIAQRMKALGYATGIIGKWHLGSDTGYRPTERGFDEFFGFYPFGIAAKDVQLYRGLEPQPAPANYMEAFSVEALSFIEKHKKDPFLLYLPFSAVHAPYLGQPPWINKLDADVPASRRKYGADIIQMDDVIGRVMKKLQDSGLEEKTLVFFISDNGGPGGVASNAPLFGTKWTLWEGGIHVPFIAQWKGRIPAGKTIDAPVIQLDVIPTALAAAGVSVKPDGLDGENILPLLTGKNPQAPHDALYWRFGIQYAVRQGNMKLVKPHIDMKPRLHDLSKDIGEQKDIADANPEKVQQLQAMWDAWNAKNEPPRWIDNRWNGEGAHAKKAGKKKTKKNEDDGGPR
ncbi:MAG: sulfatase-like hydrolase/transferase [Spirochaetes bacterium]|nr:sulfatase-like hydrolase/transferase [Spirochaetota bacterium]